MARVNFNGAKFKTLGAGSGKSSSRSDYTALEILPRFMVPRQRLSEKLKEPPPAPEPNLEQ